MMPKTQKGRDFLIVDAVHSTNRKWKKKKSRMFRVIRDKHLDLTPCDLFGFYVEHHFTTMDFTTFLDLIRSDEIKIRKFVRRLPII